MVPLLLLLGAVWAPLASAQFGSRVGVKASFSPAEAAPGDLVTLKLQAEIQEGYYIYAPDSPEEGGIPARVEFTKSGGLKPEGELRFTDPKEKWDDVFEVTIRILRGRPVFEQDFRVPKNASGTIELSGILHTQACDDRTCVIAAPTFDASLAIGAAAGRRVSIAATFEPDTADPGEIVSLKIELRIGDSYYVYAPTSPAGLPAEVEFEPMEGLEPVGEMALPDPVVKYDEIFEEDVHLYFKQAILRQQFRVSKEVVPGELSLSGTLTGQACDESTCTNESLPFKAVLKVVAATAGAGAEQGAASPPGVGEPVENVGGEDLGTLPISAFLLLAVFWGFITLLMPCTYPMIPITISFFTKQAIAREGRVLPLSLAYGAGIVLVFILIGVALGAPIITFAQHPVTNLAIGSLFLIFALVLFGAIDLQPPRFLMAVAGKASTKSGLTGVFLMGATLVVTSFTCTAPFVGSLLSVGAADGDIGRIVLGMGVFGLTMATPFVFLSLLPGRLQQMPRAGEWMHVLKVFLGFVELA
ncbi:MAG: protein-disulfide reductase DsbD domain-containing protein, partial [Planctomycetota bacterium]